jgi:hypothetical protein
VEDAKSAEIYWTGWFLTGIHRPNGGRIEGTEGGLRIDVFDHDENSEYDFSESDCTVCELPEHAQNHIIEDIEYEENA